MHDLRNKAAYGDVITKEEYQVISDYKFISVKVYIMDYQHYNYV
ncbi:MAG: hypothetical protein ACERKN_22505 [Velocimicrobium sp.]